MSGLTRSLPEAALQWTRDSLRSRGLVGSAKYLGEQLLLLVRDSMPDRKRSRFGDIDYDCDYGVDTTWARLPFTVRLREVFTERLYQPTFPEEFDGMLQHLSSVDFQQFTFIDLGSGKGRALLLAAMYPFREIIGVEVQRDLHLIAERNIATFDMPGVQCRNIHTICEDGRDFRFPATPLVLYLFNPFPAYVLQKVVNNLHESVRQAPREIYVIYNTPLEREVTEREPWLRKIAETFQYVIYSAQSR